jgi:hypothetical protein
MMIRMYLVYRGSNVRLSWGCMLQYTDFCCKHRKICLDLGAQKGLSHGYVRLEAGIGGEVHSLTDYLSCSL